MVENENKRKEKDKSLDEIFRLVQHHRETRFTLFEIVERLNSRFSTHPKSSN